MISDRPGGLATLTRTIAESGANIKEIVHDRAFSGSDVSATHVVCTVETRDRRHLLALRARLQRAGFPFVVGGATPRGAAGRADPPVRRAPAG